MLISFIDVLYGIAIGTGFIAFPKNPLTDMTSSLVFLFTLLISAHDWYEYHTNEKYGEGKMLFYFVIQIFIVLMLNQMFIHASDTTITAWLSYYVIFVSLNVIWNFFLMYENHRSYVISNVLMIAICVVIILNIDLFGRLPLEPKLIVSSIVFLLHFAHLFLVEYVINFLNRLLKKKA